MSITVGADLLFVLGQGGQARGIGAELGADDIEMAAFHRQLEVLQGAGLDRHRMHGDADTLAETCRNGFFLPRAPSSTT